MLYPIKSDWQYFLTKNLIMKHPVQSQGGGRMSSSVSMREHGFVEHGISVSQSFPVLSSGQLQTRLWLSSELTHNPLFKQGDIVQGRSKWQTTLAAIPESGRIGNRILEYVDPGDAPKRPRKNKKPNVHRPALVWGTGL